MRVEGGTGSDVSVEVTRGGADASKLTIADRTHSRSRDAPRHLSRSPGRVSTGRVGSRWRSRTTLRVDDDGTFGDDTMTTAAASTSSAAVTGSTRTPTSASSCRNGKRVSVFLGVGEAKIDNVDGDLYVDVSAAPVTSTRTRGQALARHRVRRGEGDRRAGRDRSGHRVRAAWR